MVCSSSASEGIPAKFHPPKCYKFPSRRFGAKEEKRSFTAEWCDKYDWLHYDTTTDAAFRHVCLTVEFEKRFLDSTKGDPAFIHVSRGYTTWKDATKAFNSQSNSCCHKEAVLARDLPKQTSDVDERLSSEHEKQKAENKEMFQKILQNQRFLARQAWHQGDTVREPKVTSLSYCICEHLIHQLF